LKDRFRRLEPLKTRVGNPRASTLVQSVILLADTSDAIAHDQQFAANVGKFDKPSSHALKREIVAKIRSWEKKISVLFRTEFQYRQKEESRKKDGGKRRRQNLPE